MLRLRIRAAKGAERHYEKLRDYVAEWANRRLAPRLEKAGWIDEPLFVAINTVGKDAEAVEIRLHMALPRRQIAAAQAQGADVLGVAEEALRRLRDRIEKALVRLRRQDRRRRRGRSQRLEALKEKFAAMAAEPARAAAAAFAPMRDRLCRVARRELAFLRATGDLPTDYPTLEDVLDEALVAAKVDWSGAAARDAYEELLAALFRVLDKEVAYSCEVGEMESLQAQPPDDADDQAEDMVGEEIFEFYQPDAALSLADIVPAPAADAAGDAGETMKEAAVQPAIHALQAAQDLPALWRRILLLSDMDRLDSRAIARILDISRDEAAEIGRHARAFLFARLSQRGVDPSSERLSSLFIDRATDQ